MVLNVISFFCAILLGIGIGTFIAFIISYLKGIKTKVDSIPEHKWSMRIYMDDIPQTEQNTSYLRCVLLKTYENSKYSYFPIWFTVPLSCMFSFSKSKVGTDNASEIFSDTLFI